MREEDKKRIIDSLVVVISTTAKLIYEQNQSVMKSSVYRHEAAFINYVISGAQHIEFPSRIATVNLRSGPMNFMKHLKLFETEKQGFRLGDAAFKAVGILPRKL